MDPFCAQCGASLVGAVNFCGGCGAALVVSSAPARAERRTPAWLPFAMIGVLGVAGLGAAYWVMQRDAPPAALAASDDAAVGAPQDDAASWLATYSDTFLSEPVTMITSAAARQRDFPTADGSTVQRTLNAGEQVSGRWVRGRDPATSWLKLASGGYVWEGNLAVPGGPGSPIAIPFTNAASGYGRDIDAYITQASDAARASYDRANRLPVAERERALTASEMASTYQRVPNRRFRGLTVTAVAVHYESSSIYFREGVDVVRAAWRAGGLEVNPDGNIPLPNAEVESCAIYALTGAEDRRYGATALTCGV